MEARIIDQFHIGEYTALILDSNVPMIPYNSYIIDGVRYKPVPYYPRPLTGRIIRNIIAIQASGEFVGKTVSFE